MANSSGIPKLPIAGGSDREIARAVNQTIDRFHYHDSETVCGVWVDDKPLYRKVITNGALPNSASTSVAHSVGSLGTVVLLRGIADNGTTQFTFPGTDSSGNITSIRLSASNIVVSTDWTASAYTTSYSILEYTKTTD